jgi:hypothetical protein
MSKFKEHEEKTTGTEIIATTTGGGGLNVFEAYGASGGPIEGEKLTFKRGSYYAGKDKRKIELGTRFIAGVHTVQFTWTKWIDRQPVDRRSGYLLDAYVPPKREELDANDESLWPVGDDGEPKDPWVFTTSIVLVHAETKETFTFITTSKGGSDAIKSLSRAYGRKIRTEPSAVPEIALDASSYPHPKRSFGEIDVPVFRISGWTESAPTAPQDAEPDDPIPF